MVAMLDNAEYWDTQAIRWGVFSVPDEDYDKYTAKQAAFIVEQLNVTNGALLDMGCGIGRLSQPISRLIDAKVWGIDPSREMIAMAIELDWVGDRSIHYGRKVGTDFFQDPYRYIPIPMDGAWCVLVFQHLPEAPIRKILYDLAHVLRPGARLVTQWMLDIDQPFPSRRNVLRVLEEEGFQTVRDEDDTDVTGLSFADNWLWVTSEKTAR